MSRICRTGEFCGKNNATNSDTKYLARFRPPEKLAAAGTTGNDCSVIPHFLSRAGSNRRGMICAALLLFSACQQPLTEVKPQTVEAHPAKAQSLLGLNQRDLDQLANTEITHLFASGLLDPSPPATVVLALQLRPGSDTLDLQANAVLQQIRGALLQSGKVLFRDSKDTGGSTPISGVLSGKFSQSQVEDHGSTQVAYDFDLELKNASGELTRWSDHTTLTKTMRKASTGW